LIRRINNRGIKWEDIHIGNSLLSNSIFIGKSKPMKDNPKLSIWSDKSKGMYAVCCKLKQEQEEREDERPYAGYEYEDGSQLIWIKPNTKIEIKSE
jgi:hypothetical protein